MQRPGLSCLVRVAGATRGSPVKGPPSDGGITGGANPRVGAPGPAPLGRGHQGGVRGAPGSVPFPLPRRPPRLPPQAWRGRHPEDQGRPPSLSGPASQPRNSEPTALRPDAPAPASRWPAFCRARWKCGSASAPVAGGQSHWQEKLAAQPRPRSGRPSPCIPAAVLRLGLAACWGVRLAAAKRRCCTPPWGPLLPQGHLMGPACPVGAPTAPAGGLQHLLESSGPLSSPQGPDPPNSSVRGERSPPIGEGAPGMVPAAAPTDRGEQSRWGARRITCTLCNAPPPLGLPKGHLTHVESEPCS